MNAIKEAHYNLGIAYLEAGQYNRAVPEFEAAIKLDADFIGAHCALCRAYLEQDALEKASASVTAALKLDDTHQPALLLCDTLTQAYYDKGRQYHGAERYSEAVSTFQKALTLAEDLERSSQDPDIKNKHIYAHLGAAYIGLKAYQEAIDALQNAIALDPDLVDAHYNLGYAYVEQGSYDQAIPHLERAIAIAPNFKRAHYNLARAYRELGNLEAATHAVTETLRLDPNYQRAHELANSIKQAHYNRGITYLNDERHSEAVTAFQNAITLDSDFTTAHYNLGLTYLKMETYSRAVDALQKTITLDRNYKAAHHSLALAYLGQQELGKARDAAKDTLKLDANYQPALSLLEAIDPSFTPSATQTSTPPEPEQPTAPQSAGKPRQETHYELGIAYKNSKMYTEAIAEFQKAIDLDPDFVAAHTSLGEIYLETGRLDDAEKAANAALRIDANSQPARQLLNDIKQVRSTQSTQSTGTPSHVTDIKKHYERGEAFLNNGQYNEAAAAFKRAIKADPSYADAHYSLGVAYLEIGALDDAKMAAEVASKLNADRQLIHELLTAIKHVETSQRRRKLWKKGLSYAVVLGMIAAVIIFIVNWLPEPDPPDPLPVPPIFSIGASLSRDYLLGGQTVKLTLTIKNSGGTVHNVKIQLQPQSISGLNYETPAPIPEILKSDEETIEIPIKADRNIGNREESLKIELIGNNGTSLATTDILLRMLDTVR
ncbi:MAG: tetratricopeptide repeat protein [Candidatus Poribacteria bacterium]|nr:tetratricopeptide repeat protein [Candidatus Poribacteria bacterium]